MVVIWNREDYVKKEEKQLVVIDAYEETSYDPGHFISTTVIRNRNMGRIVDFLV